MPQIVLDRLLVHRHGPAGGHRRRGVVPAVGRRIVHHRHAARRRRRMARAMTRPARDRRSRPPRHRHRDHRRHRHPGPDVRQADEPAVFATKARGRAAHLHLRLRVGHGAVARGLHVDFAGAHTGWHDFPLVPDLATLRRAAWLENTAICLADCVDEPTGSSRWRWRRARSCVGRSTRSPPAASFALPRPSWSSTCTGGRRASCVPPGTGPWCPPPTCTPTTTSPKATRWSRSSAGCAAPSTRAACRSTLPRWNTGSGSGRSTSSTPTPSKWPTGTSCTSRPSRTMPPATATPRRSCPAR